MTGHLDQMWPDLTSVFTLKFGVTPGIMLCINKMIENLTRNVKAALGISTTVYSQLTSSSRIGGIVQGQEDVPQLSTQQLDVMLTSHKVLAPGLSLWSPNLQRVIQRKDILYANDTMGTS